jgi:cytochrome c553
MKSGKWLAAIALMSAAPILYCASGIAAQPAGAKPDNADLRAVYATVQEIGEGKSVANTCSRCHGANGISTTKGTPHIAGQRPAYLYTKLKAYQTGVRRCSRSPRTLAVSSLRRRWPRQSKRRHHGLIRLRPARRRRQPAPVATATAASAKYPECRASSAWTRSIW